MPSPTTVVNGIRANFGVSDCGQLMGKPTEAALASIEPEGTYEHLAVGVLEEGFTLCYKDPGGTDHVKWDVYDNSNGIVCGGSHICRNDKGEFVKSTESRTDDGLIAIRQTFTISKNATRVIIRMDITNCQPDGKSLDLKDFLVKRYADIDVDTGGTAGWAAFQAYWDKTRYSIFSYNLDGDAPKGKRAHVVNMVAMPSDLVLEDPFIGQLGAHQYKFRNNPSPAAAGRTDGDGVLQWSANRFLAGETFRINMYYDAFRSFAK
jgi:hypothetical protein